MLSIREARRPALMADDFRSIPQPLQTNAGIAGPPSYVSVNFFSYQPTPFDAMQFRLLSAFEILVNHR
jgi:hypothetical protein